MSYANGPRIITDGLVFCVDVGNTKSYSGTGTSLYDLAKNNVGELVNSPVYNTDGNNKYFSFNGTTNSRYIKIPNNTDLDTNTPSVEVWIKTNATSQNGFWFEKGTVNSQYSLFQESNVITWRTYISGVGFRDIDFVHSLNTSDWFQIVGTYSSGDKKLYINGSSVSTSTQTGTINTNTGGMSIGVFGGYTGSHNYYYNGNIAIVRVYNKQLSDSEVLNNFNANKGRFGL